MDKEEGRAEWGVDWQSGSLATTCSMVPNHMVEKRNTRQKGMCWVMISGGCMKQNAGSIDPIKKIDRYIIYTCKKSQN